MKRTSEIPWFNPRQMDEATVLALNTGRDKLLAEFYEAVRKRQDAPQAGGHWLLTGPRGSGKSFFLRLVQTTFRRMIGDSATFVLLPEELPNVFSPVEWLREVERMLPGNSGDIGKSPTWQTKDDTDAWESALTSLLAAFTGKLLVIGVENFDKVLELAFDSEVRASRLRKLMENEPRIMLLATAVEGDFDEDYEQRMFRQFEHHVVPRWTPPDHRHYLSRRAQLVGKVATRNQLARIDAYSRFTGGSARIAAVMAGAILDEQDPLNASSNLTATLDRMSDYYRSLHEKMPVNTRKVFDALIRGGEPASQVEIAARVEARQNDISRAFGWLVDHGYVIDEREPGRKESRYRVADRLFVQFFRMRYLAPDQPSRLSILADLLSETIEFGQKWNFAEGYLAQGHSPEARTMAELACAERGVDLSLMPEDSKSVELLVEMGKTWRFLESMKHDVSLNYERFFSRYETDEQFHAAIKHTHDLASAKKRGNLVGRKYADIADRSVFASPLVRMILFALVLNPEFSDEQGAAVSELFEQERKLLNKLAALDPDGLKSLTVSSETARRFPLASSLTTVTETGTANGVGNGPQLAPQKIASWSARAAILWFGHKRTEDAIKSLATWTPSA